MKTCLGLAAALLTGASLPAAAQAPTFQPPAIASLPPCPVSDPAHEAADQAAVTSAMQAAHQAGLRAVGPHLNELKQALDHAPAGLAPVERCGAQVVVTTSLTDFLLYSLAYAPALKGRTDITGVSFKPSPYPMAAFLIGSYDDELGDYAAAVPVLRRGLAMEPMEPTLVTEAASALSQLKRFDEALDLCDERLKHDDTLDKRNHARLLRSRGTALEGEGRLDEAEAAYQASLQVEPGNAIALNELSYIAHLRAGAPVTDTRMTLSKPAPQPPG